MRILVVGSGGREHALAWKLKLSPRVETVLVAPGNAGTATVGENVAAGTGDIPSLVAYARDNAVDLTVVGPEAPLVDGMVDALEAAGLRAFGPTAAAARLEGSKAFAKTFMLEEGIPTPRAEIFSDYEAARDALTRRRGPIVVKADGLAAGKGVILCDTQEEAQAALREIMIERAFGAAGDQVLLEERIEGEEVSVLAFSDGSTIVPLLPARDYKRALENDQGLNTGGMGGYAPSAILTPALVERVMAQVLQPTVEGMRRRGTPFVGILYAGLMLTADGPQVLEFNARFGDPETQLLLPLLQTDLVDIMLACIEGTLGSLPIHWHAGYSVGVVLASGGYPSCYETGKVITGLDEAAAMGSTIFHAGTRKQNGDIVTAGGRVLAVTSLGPTLEEARRRAYSAAGRVNFEGMHYRTDIAVPQTSDAYARAGVDIDAGERAVALMKNAVRQTYTDEVLGGIGAFGGSISVEALARKHKLVLVATNDGVGTKTLIAEAMGIFDTVGHDIVNHCANDILVQGARPLFFLDYIAAAKLDPEQIGTIVSGCAAACKSLGCVLIGGETAEMPGVYRPGAFDLVGTMVGWVDRDELLDGSRVRPGDILLGLPSSGLHTNGFSLARRVLEPLGWETVWPGFDKPLGEALLAPHRPYLREIEALWAAGVPIKAMSHLTGGAYVENIPRVLPEGVGAAIDRSAWEVPAIFRLIQTEGDVAEMQMYRVYNMGIGMVLMMAPEAVGRARALLPELIVMGETIAYEGAGPRVKL
jgi:phosphoribosylamine--glycine ligase / phosphoribosylformylglycinamidine cyclo-ligase